MFRRLLRVLPTCALLVLCLGSVSYAKSDPSPLLPVRPPPIPDGCNCNTLVAEEEGCCTPKEGRPFTMTPCLCSTCFEGTFAKEVCPPKPCVCTREFQPVCCDLGDGSQRTTGNACECESCGSGGEVVSQGTCPPTITKITEPSPCICTLEFNPLCCENADGSRTTTGNKCQCEQCGQGGKVVSQGTCPPTATKITEPSPCPCTLQFDPVCCENADGSRTTAGNKCQCERCGLGGEVVSKGECPSGVTCANVRCAGPGPCVDTPDGPICTTTVNPTCAALKCANCEDTPEGPVCGAVTPPPPVKPSCATLQLECANCMDTPDGPVCVPPAEPSCATLKCANCVETSDGPVCGAVTTPPSDSPCYY